MGGPRNLDDTIKYLYLLCDLDEEALVKGAAAFGLVLTTRTPTSVIVSVVC